MYTVLDKHNKHNNAELRPCFWCGCEYLTVYSNSNNNNFVKIECVNCRIQTPITTFKEAVKRWNSNPITGEVITGSKVTDIIEAWVDNKTDKEGIWPYGIEAEKLKILLEKIRQAL